MLRHICPGFLTFGLVVLLIIDQSSPAFLALAEDSHGAAEVTGITFPLEVNVTYQAGTLDSACRAFAILDSFDLDASFSDPLSLRDLCLPPGGVSNSICDTDLPCCRCGGENGSCAHFVTDCRRNVGTGKEGRIVCSYEYNDSGKLVITECMCGDKC